MGETFFALTGLAMFQGETYAQGNKAQMEHSRSFFQTLAFNDKVVLDCGCGDGRATLEFVGSQNVKKLYAFDPSESQIETARQRVVGKDNVSFFTAGFDNFLDVECGGVLQRFVAGINMHRNLIPEELRPEFDKAAAFELRKTPYFVGSDRLTMLSPAIEMRAYKEKPKKEV